MGSSSTQGPRRRATPCDVCGSTDCGTSLVPHAKYPFLPSRPKATPKAANERGKRAHHGPQEDRARHPEEDR
jgi:hypothetical protein